MKMLYIDNKRYIHNADSHIDFFASLNDSKIFKVLGYGRYLSHRISHTVQPSSSPEKDLLRALRTHRPDVIVTYNSGPNISDLYGWTSDFLAKIDLPKFHIATDYMRDETEPDESDFFRYVGYKAVFFRHMESLKRPTGVDKIHLPFSIKASLYSQNLRRSLGRKRPRVGFIGSSSAYPDLYANRIAAMKKLKEKNLLRETRFLDKVGRNQMMFSQSYVRFLTDNLFNLTCGGTCNYFVAKYIQIPAAYSMLVCADVPGLESFPKDSYIKYDINNLEKMIDDITAHLLDQDMLRQKIDLLYKHVILEHNHKVRGKQLKEQIIRYL